MRCKSSGRIFAVQNFVLITGKKSSTFLLVRWYIKWLKVMGVPDIAVLALSLRNNNIIILLQDNQFNIQNCVNSWPGACCHGWVCFLQDCHSEDQGSFLVFCNVLYSYTSFCFCFFSVVCCCLHRFRQLKYLVRFREQKYFVRFGPQTKVEATKILG